MTTQSTRRALLATDELQNWRLTAWRPHGRMWALDDGVFHGFCSNTWVGHTERFTDLLLECDILYDGYGGGDICIRGDRDADKTWEHGYNFAIVPNQDHARGYIIPTTPPGCDEAGVEFNVNEWTRLRISAVSGRIQVQVTPGARLDFVDPENRFPLGQICLSDQSCQEDDHCECDGSGHIKFRNLTIEPVL